MQEGFCPTPCLGCSCAGKGNRSGKGSFAALRLENREGREMLDLGFHNHKVILPRLKCKSD